MNLGNAFDWTKKLGDTPRYLSAIEISEAFNKGRLTAQDIAKDLLQQIEWLEPKTRAWEYFDRDLFLQQASDIDARRNSYSGKSLAAVPVAVKDVFNTEVMPTTMGSEIWQGFTPGNDARVVYDLKQHGAYVQGKTVTAEFAVHYLAAEKTLNPQASNRIPGTSSSGSAAAVASFMSPIALGTQTAGSVIRPASYCGVIGFKPTFGTIPRTGVLKTTDTLDTVGLFTRDVRDAEVFFDAIRVKGRDYPLVHERLVRPKASKKYRVKVVRDHLMVCKNFTSEGLSCLELVEKEIEKFCMVISDRSFSVPAYLNQVHALHELIYDKTLSYYFKQEAETVEKISPVMRQMIDKGSKIRFEEYSSAIQRQAEIREAFHQDLNDVDLIVTLSTVGEAPLLGEEEKADTCLIWTFLGMPALSLPLGKGPNDLPIGVQLVAKRFDDYVLLDFAKMLQERFKG